MLADVVFALRQLRQAPVFAVTAILALALGIGANTAIFSVVHGVLLRPLPFPAQERLVVVSEWSEQVPGMSVSYPNYVDFRARQTSFEALGAARNQSFNLARPDEAVRLAGGVVSADLFPALGIAPLRGRVFGAADDQPGAARTVVVSEGLWRRVFGGADDILGQTLDLSGQLYTVVGVMPAGFFWPSPQTELWVPLGLWAKDFENRGSHPGLYGLGRLKPGVSLEQAETELKAIAAQLAAEYPESNAGNSARVQALNDRVFGQVRPVLLVLLGAAACVLLIACANVANLQLARAQARAREFAVRSALGAGRARLVRQLVLESVVLGTLGCLAGLFVGAWALSGLKSALPPNLPRVDAITLDGTVLGFAVLLSLATSVLFGLVPAWNASRQDLRTTLAEGTRGSSVGSGARWRATLIVGEFALTCVLLVGAGLMLRTLDRLHRADPGYRTDSVLTFGWVLTGAEFSADERRVQLLEAALARLATLPGVAAASTINPLPLSGSGNQNSYLPETHANPGPGRLASTEVFRVDPTAFDTLGIRLIAGRGFTSADRAGVTPVAVVDVTFAKKNFGSPEAALGQRFGWGGHAGKPEEWNHIVGVVEHIENYGLGRDTREQCYQPIAQSPSASTTFLLRTSGDPAALVSTARAAMREVAPRLPIFGERTMDDWFHQSIGTQRLAVALLGAFAALALLLAAVGLYGVLAYHVGQRRREIGVRLALGATPRSVLTLVWSHGLKLAGLGLGVGIVAALLATRALQSVLFEVSALDPWSFAAVIVLLLVIGSVACLVPALRATRVNPVEALRSE